MNTVRIRHEYCSQKHKPLRFIGGNISVLSVWGIKPHTDSTLMLPPMLRLHFIQLSFKEMRSSSQIHRRLNRLLHISSLEHGHYFQVATFIFAVRQRSGECYVFTRVCLAVQVGGDPCTGPRHCPPTGS